MPAFALISGFLGKGRNNLEPYKLTKQILIPLITFNLIYEIINFFLTGDVSGYLKIGAPYWIMWFLLSLLCWHVIASILFSLRHPLIISIILSLGFQFIDFSTQTLSIMRTVNFLPYFIMGGVIFKKNIHNNSHNRKILILSLCTSILTLIALSKLTPTIFLYGAFPFSHFETPTAELIIFKLINYIAVPFLVLPLIFLKPTCKTLERFGRKSMNIYLIHGLFILYASSYLNQHGSLLFILAASVAISFVTCHVLSSTFISIFVDRFFSAVQKNMLSKASH